MPTRVPSLLAALPLAASVVACTPQSSPAPGGSTPAPATTFTKHVSFAIVQDYREGDSLAVVERDLARARALGVATWQGALRWEALEPERGRYDFAWLHGFADRAKSAGVALRPTVDGPRVSGADRLPGGPSDVPVGEPSRGVEAWELLVDTLVTAMRRHDNVVSWALDIGQHPPAADSALARGLRVARRANPNALAFGAGSAGPDARSIARACAAARGAGGLPVATVRAGTETWAPEPATVETWLANGYRERFLPAVTRACGTVPVWVEASGLATSKGRTEHEQAAWWVRALASWLALPRVEQVAIGTLRDDGAGAGDAAHAGLVTADGRPKLAFETVKLLVSLLNTGRLTVADGELVARARDTMPGRPYHHLFVRPDGRQVLVAWVQDGTASMEYVIPRGGREARLCALDGTCTPWSSFDGRTLGDVALVAGTPRVFVIEP